MVKYLQVNKEKNFKIDKRFVHRIVSKLKDDLDFKISSLVINFVTSEQIKEINIKYLNHQYSTDVITFNYSGSNTELDGEIFISVEDANEYAEMYKVTHIEELMRLVIHGVLHLLGYDDMNRKEKVLMKKMENKLLNSYKITLLEKSES